MDTEAPTWDCLPWGTVNSGPLPHCSCCVESAVARALLRLCRQLRLCQGLRQRCPRRLEHHQQPGKSTVQGLVLAAPRTTAWGTDRLTAPGCAAQPLSGGPAALLSAGLTCMVALPAVSGFEQTSTLCRLLACRMRLRGRPSLWSCTSDQGRGSWSTARVRAAADGVAGLHHPPVADRGLVRASDACRVWGQPATMRAAASGTARMPAPPQPVMS